jgi:hypothetical protein
VQNAHIFDNRSLSFGQLSERGDRISFDQNVNIWEKVGKKWGKNGKTKAIGIDKNEKLWYNQS